MAIYYDAPVAPDDITTFVRGIPAPRLLTFSNEIQPVYDDQNVIDWSTILETNRAAQFRSFDGSIHVSERDSGNDNRVRMIPLSDSLSMGEYERLQREFVRFQGQNVVALEQAIYNDATKLTRNVQNRLELAWGDIFTDGKLTINEGGYQGEADFGVPGSQKVTAGTAWSNPAALILSDLLSWTDTYYANNGILPEVIRVTRLGFRNLAQNTQLINAAYGAQTGRTRASLADINNVLAAQGLPPVVIYNAGRFSVDVNGVPTTTSVIADNIVLLTPADLNDIAKMHFGVSATALELVNAADTDFSFEEAPGIVGVVEKDGPPYRQFTFVDSVVMPVLANAYLLMIASV